jgi:hypothetical protein
MRKYQRRRGNTFESGLSRPNQTLYRKRHAMGISGLDVKAFAAFHFKTREPVFTNSNGLICNRVR